MHSGSSKGSPSNLSLIRALKQKKSKYGKGRYDQRALEFQFFSYSFAELSAR
jgi:hypothetical protein